MGRYLSERDRRGLRDLVAQVRGAHGSRRPVPTRRRHVGGGGGTTKTVAQGIFASCDEPIPAAAFILFGDLPAGEQAEVIAETGRTPASEEVIVRCGVSTGVVKIYESMTLNNGDVLLVEQPNAEAVVLRNFTATELSQDRVLGVVQVGDRDFVFVDPCA